MVEMDRAEKLLVHSPLVTFVHRDILLPRMLRLARVPVDGPLLELGAGPGTTTEGLLRRLPGADITALDVDAEEVERARRRLGLRASVEQGDAEHLAHPDGTFGTVVEMNTFHHIPRWQTAIREVHRVLRHRGQFLFTDYTTLAFGGAFANPRFQPGAFTPEQFALALHEAGFATVVLRGEWVILGRAEKRA
jgi:ubiquinone/menaquinone biosynthesis C-methylase UbiE